jgi:hypothetical protein
MAGIGHNSQGAGFLLPNDAQRCTIIGKTGSGKTTGALWQLSHRSYDKRPWIIVDTKYDDTIAMIPNTREIGLREKLPTAKQPGLYVTHPHPNQKEEIDAFLWRIHAQGGIGVFVDEGYMIPDGSPSFQAILTQGRSKRIPVMMLTQRPSWVTRFAFSEADHIQLFQVTDLRDVKVAKQFMPLPIEEPLPAPYHSWWWDNARNYKALLSPVPDTNTILDTFYERTRQRKSVY